ncbi:MAG: hypothetical protein Kow0068_17670 [Marinilabiliales bacterium]
MKTGRYIVIGLVAVFTIVLAIWGINFLQGKKLFGEQKEYHAIYDRIDGLVETSPVMIKGLLVGKVTEIRFIPDSEKTFVVFVSFTVEDENLRIPDSSIAEIASVDLMGTKAINLIFSKSTNYHKYGDTLLSSIESTLKEQVSREMLPLKRKAEDLMLSIDSVMAVIQSIFNANSRENISKSLYNIRKTLQTLERTTFTLDTLVQSEKSKLAHIFSNLESITTNFRNNNEKLSNIMANFSNISDSLAKTNLKTTIDKATNTLITANEILDKINNGEGTLGLLLNNDTLYNNLESSAKDLDKLLKDIEANPKKYLHFSIFDFGKTYVIDEDGNVVKPKKRNRNNNGETSDNQIKFRVQIKSAMAQIPLSSDEFKGMSGIDEIYYNGMYKYTVGDEINYESAKLLQQEVRKAFPDAFIIAVKDNKIIPVSQALKEI